MDKPPLVSLSLTHVSYDPNDIFSWISAHLALVPQALIISYVTLIWATREIEVALMLAGQLGCEALNYILKRTFKEARPTDIVGKGYGMPSSHAQYAAFFSVYISLFLLFRHDPINHPHASSTHIPTPVWQRAGLAILSVFSAAAVAQSRIYLNYHTPRQVVVGCAAGAVCAVGWFVVTAVARQMGFVEKMLELPPLKWIRMRDLVVSESLEDAGWERYQRALTRRAEQLGKKKR